MPSANPAPIASPCVSVCRISDQTGLCVGCLRTLEEIALWSQYANEEKAEVLRLVNQRQHPDQKPG